MTNVAHQAKLSISFLFFKNTVISTFHTQHLNENDVDAGTED